MPERGNVPKLRHAVAVISLLCVGASSGRPVDYCEGELIVGLERGVRCSTWTGARGNPRASLHAFDSLNTQLGCRMLRRAAHASFADPALASRCGLDRAFHLRFDAGRSVDSLVEAYQGLGCVEYAEPNRIVRSLSAAALYPNDIYFNWLWGLDNREKFGFGDRWTPKPDADIDAPEAWDITTGDSSVIVAILDSGCKTSHPELAGRFWRNPGETPDNGSDDDGNGYTDDMLGWDFWYDDNVPEDSGGHGTAVTGVVGANGNNGVGHAGVDWQCKLMIAKVMRNDGDGTNITTLGEAVQYAADNGADVMNISLGDDRGSVFLRNAVDYAYNLGVVIVAASGNDNLPQVLFPAAYGNVIAVGSTDPDDRRSDHFGPDTSSEGSNYGAALDVVAPGNNIFCLNYIDDTLFSEGASGTSLASPHVAGIAALLLAQDPSRTPAQIRTLIEQSADDLVGDSTEDTPGWDQYMGHGRVSAYNALAVTLVKSGMRRSAPGFAATVTASGVSLNVVVRIGASAAGRVGVSVLTLDGRRLGRRVGTAAAGQPVVMQLPRPASPGVYLLRVAANGTSRQFRVVVPKGGGGAVRT